MSPQMFMYLPHFTAAVSVGCCCLKVYEPNRFKIISWSGKSLSASFVTSFYRRAAAIFFFLLHEIWLALKTSLSFTFHTNPAASSIFWAERWLLKEEPWPSAAFCLMPCASSPAACMRDQNSGSSKVRLSLSPSLARSSDSSSVLAVHEDDECVDLRCALVAPPFQGTYTLKSIKKCINRKNTQYAFICRNVRTHIVPPLHTYREGQTAGCRALPNDGVLRGSGCDLGCPRVCLTPAGRPLEGSTTDAGLCWEPRVRAIHTHTHTRTLAPPPLSAHTLDRHTKSKKMYTHTQLASIRVPDHVFLWANTVSCNILCCVYMDTQTQTDRTHASIVWIFTSAWMIKWQRAGTEGRYVRPVIRKLILEQVLGCDLKMCQAFFTLKKWSIDF